MSYQVMARRWRPQKFSDLIGQDHVSQTILNSLKNQRIPHALLFTGPRGVGKTSTARIFAKTLKCPKVNAEFTPCNECDVCTEISQSSNIDVIEIDGASNNGVEAIREIRENVGYMPTQGKYKIYIIDEVHMLTINAFNALLKTLEEPPPHIIFIFATTEAQKIPATILSRCQRFDLRRIPTLSIVNQLKSICESEDAKITNEALWILARLSDGSMRDSQSLLEQATQFCDKNITEQKLVDAFGLIDRTLIKETLDGLTERNIQKTLNVVEKIYFSGIEAFNFMQSLLLELRNLLLIKISNSEQTKLIDLTDSEISYLKKISHSLTTEDIHLLFDMALKGAQDIQKAIEPKIVLEMVLLRLSQAPKVIDIMTLQTQMASQIVASQETQKEVILNPESWAQFVNQIQKEKPTLAAKLIHTSVLSQTTDELKLVVSKKMSFIAEQLSDKKTNSEILSLVKKYLGLKNPLIKVETGDTGFNSPKDLQDKIIQEKNDKIKTEVESSPLLKEINKSFKTKIASIREKP